MPRSRAAVVELTLLAHRLQGISLATEREAFLLGEQRQAGSEARGDPAAVVVGTEAPSEASGTVLSEIAERLQSHSVATEWEAVRLREHLDALDTQLREPLARLAVVEGRVADLQHDADALRADLASSESTISALSAESERAHAEVDTVSAQLESARLELEATRAQLAAAERARGEHERYIMGLSASLPGRLARRWIDLRRDHARAARLIRLPWVAARAVLGTLRLGRLRKHPLFDEEWYVVADPEAREHRLGPWWHYMSRGEREGRAPNAYLDPDWYLRTYPDVRRSGMSPLDHYHRFGCWEGRDPSPRFSTSRYLAQHPELSAARIDPLWHYLRHGQQGDFRALGAASAGAVALDPSEEP